MLLTFVSCSSTKNLTDKDLIGKYRFEFDYWVNSTIDLKEDNTFEYEWIAGLTGGTTHGTWKRERNKIILNSDLQKSDDYEIIRTDNKQSDSITVKMISATDNLPLPGANCMLKLNKKIVKAISANLDGIAVLPKIEADSLEMSFIGYGTIRHKLDSDITYYEFKMKEDFFYEYFTEDIWIFKSGKLYNSEKNKYLKIPNPN